MLPQSRHRRRPRQRDAELGWGEQVNLWLWFGLGGLAVVYAYYTGKAVGERDVWREVIRKWKP